MWLSLKHKVTLTFGVTILILMSIGALSAQHLVRRTIEEDLYAQMEQAGQTIFSTFYREQERWGWIDPREAEALIQQSLVGRLSIVQVRVAYEGVLGNWRRSYVFMPQYFPTEPDGTINEESEPLIGTIRGVFTDVLPNKGELTLRVDVSTADADYLAQGLTNLFTFITMGGMLFLLALTYFMVHRLVSAPLGVLSRMTRRVAQGQLDVPAESSLLCRKDEIGELSNAFENMIKALRKARDENADLLHQAQDFNRELEARVEDARRDLAEKNQALLVARECVGRQERLAALGQLAGNIAHEIGTPLSTLSGYLQLVLSDRSLTPDVREHLDVAAGEAQRVTRIIRRFLDSTRGLRPVLERFALKDQMQQVVELSLPAVNRERYQVVLELSPAVQEITSDPGLLRQVLTNLIKNAVDAMPEGGQLTLRANAVGSDVVIEVEDTGQGVPEASRDQIFEPFYTTKEVGRGTGLGLAISREICRALKGSLELVSGKSGAGKSGSGACFALRLPQSVPAPVFSIQVPAAAS